MTLVRLALTLFILVLVALTVAGWIWTGAHQAPAQSIASRAVLTAGALAGIVGLIQIWRR
jgi:hypothetical protein